MRSSSEEFQADLSPDESILGTCRAEVVDSSTAAAGSVGITDRRIRVVFDGGGFMDIRHDHVTLVRDTPVESLSVRDAGFLPWGAGGALVGGLALVTAVVLAGSPFAATLVVVAVGGFVLSGAVHRLASGYGAGDRPGLAVAALERLGTLDGVDARALARGLEAHHGPLLLWATVVSLVAFAGLLVFPASSLVAPLAVSAVGAVWLVDLAYRRWEEIDPEREEPRPDREVSIHLLSGRTVRVRVDGSEGFARTLDDAVRAAGGDRPALPDARSE